MVLCRNRSPTGIIVFYSNNLDFHHLCLYCTVVLVHSLIYFLFWNCCLTHINHLVAEYEKHRGLLGNVRKGVLVCLLNFFLYSDNFLP